MSARSSFPSLQLFACLFQLGDQDFFIGQGREVCADEQFGGEGVSGVAHQRLTFPGAQDDAYRRIFAGLHPVFPRVIELQVHLPGIGMVEPAQFQIKDDETAQTAMKKQQIHPEPLIVNAQTALATDKGKIVAEFQ